MAKSEERKRQWFKAEQKPKKTCGCVYSLVGYPLYICPDHETEDDRQDRVAFQLKIAEAERA